MISKTTALIRGLKNRILHQIARTVPGRFTLRPMLHRWRGVQIGKDVAIGDDVFLESEHPQAVTLNDGVHIAMRCTVVAHTRGRGKVVIDKNAFIGAGTIIVCPAGRELVIGEGAVVAAGSVVTQSIGPSIFCGPPSLVLYGRATVPLSSSNYMAFMRGLRPISRSPRQTKPGPHDTP
jgi:serine acetyltransferase